jgi:hypothetical protein
MISVFYFLQRLWLIGTRLYNTDIRSSKTKNHRIDVTILFSVTDKCATKPPSRKRKKRYIRPKKELCPIKSCKSKFERKKHLDDHIIEAHLGSAYFKNCVICSKPFKKKGRRMHYRIFHPNVEYPHLDKMLEMIKDLEFCRDSFFRSADDFNYEITDGSVFLWL